MSKRLTINLDGKTIASREFDMKCFRKVESIRNEPDFTLNKAGEIIVEELFSNTEITSDVLDMMDVPQRAILEEEAIKIYFDVLEEIIKIKNSQSPLIFKIQTKTAGI